MSKEIEEIGKIVSDSIFDNLKEIINFISETKKEETIGVSDDN